jgi:hypothetical protein
VLPAQSIVAEVSLPLFTSCRATVRLGVNQGVDGQVLLRVMLWPWTRYVRALPTPLRPKRLSEHPMTAKQNLGISGRIAAAFQANALTPLLALVALLLGLFAVLVTPREEEPQINVTMANVLIPFPGASSADVQNMVARPAEQVLSQIAGIEHTYSVARPGLAVLTVQFKVGVPRTEALVRLYDVLNANQDWLPRELGTPAPDCETQGH